MVQQLGRVLPILVEALQSGLNLVKGSDSPPRVFVIAFMTPLENVLRCRFERTAVSAMCRCLSKLLYCWGF